MKLKNRDEKIDQAFEEFAKKAQILKVATRPIRIDRGAIMDLTNRLIRSLGQGYWGRNPDEPLQGLFIFEDKIVVRTVDDREVEVFVRCKSKDSEGWKFILGGGSGKTTISNKPAIIVFINGGNTPYQIVSDKARFMKEMIEILAHEITHQEDVFAPKFDPLKKRTTLPTQDELDDSYYNNPSEVRAHMRSIFEEVRGRLEKVFYPDFEVRTIMRQIDKYSPIWRDVSGYLRESNKRIILKGVAQALQDWIEEKYE